MASCTLATSWLLRHRELAWSAPTRVGRGGHTLARQGEHEDGAARGGPVDDEAAAVSAGDVPGDGEAQSRAAVGRTGVVEPDEPLEDPVPLFRGNPGPVVDDGERGLPGPLLERDGDGAPRVADGVVEQVRDPPADLVLVAEHLHRSPPAGADPRPARPALGGKPFDDVVEVDRPGAHRVERPG